jgi:hypothetical protein
VYLFFLRTRLQVDTAVDRSRGGLDQSLVLIVRSRCAAVAVAMRRHVRDRTAVGDNQSVRPRPVAADLVVQQLLVRAHRHVVHLHQQ